MGRWQTDMIALDMALVATSRSCAFLILFDIVLGHSDFQRNMRLRVSYQQYAIGAWLAFTTTRTTDETFLNELRPI